MSRELPYFKFFTGEWLNGDITLEDMKLQGLFINVCAYYWHRDCEVTYTQLCKKFKTNLLVDLVGEFLEHDSETDQVTIEFLNEQFYEFTTRKKKLSEAGKKGAKNKADKKNSTTLQPPLIDPLTIREEKSKSNRREDKTIEERKIEFSTSLKNHLSDEFPKQTLNDFYSYWTEHGDNDKKMRFEKQTSFSILRRLGTWKRNQKDFKNGSQSNSKDNRASATKTERQSFE